MERKDHMIGLNVSGILLKLMVLAFGMWRHVVWYIDMRISGKPTAAMLRIDNGVNTPYEYKNLTHIYHTTRALSQSRLM